MHGQISHMIIFRVLRGSFPRKSTGGPTAHQASQWRDCVIACICIPHNWREGRLKPGLLVSDINPPKLQATSQAHPPGLRSKPLEIYVFLLKAPIRLHKHGSQANLERSYILCHCSSASLRTRVSSALLYSRTKGMHVHAPDTRDLMWL